MFSGRNIVAMGCRAYVRRKEKRLCRVDGAMDGFQRRIPGARHPKNPRPQPASAHHLQERVDAGLQGADRKGGIIIRFFVGDNRTGCATVRFHENTSSPPLTSDM